MPLTNDMRLPGSLERSFGDMGETFDDIFEDPQHLSDLEALSFDGVLRPNHVETVLDCTCGTGMQAVGLAKLGYKVSASDISPKMLNITRRKATEAGMSIETKRSDFRSLGGWRGRQFDAVISGGNSICVLDNIEEIDKVLASASRLLGKRGLIVIGARDYGLLRDRDKTIVPRLSKIRNDGTPEWVLDLRQFGAKRAFVAHMFLGVANGRWRIRSFVKSYLYLSALELSERLNLAGFREVEVFDQLGLNPYQGGEWYLVVGCKH